jgi:hypothetical protein
MSVSFTEIEQAFVVEANTSHRVMDATNKTHRAARKINIGQ